MPQHSAQPEYNEQVVYSCPMHPDVKSNSPGKCPICGMQLIPVRSSSHSGNAMAHGAHEHATKSEGQMTPGEKFKMSMTMTMGMEHTGLAGREMARLMELDIRRKFFVALILSVPIILYSPLGRFIFGFQPPAPIPVPWLLFLLTTPVYF